MKAAVVYEAGGPDVFKIEEVIQHRTNDTSNADL